MVIAELSEEVGVVAALALFFQLLFPYKLFDGLDLGEKLSQSIILIVPIPAAAR